MPWLVAASTPAGYNGSTRENRANTDFSLNLEQVHVIRMFRRGLRLQWVAALGVAVAMPALAASAATSQQATQTSLRMDTRDGNGRTQAILSMAVVGADGQPAAGSIAIQDRGKRWPVSCSMPRATQRQPSTSLAAITVFPPSTSATLRTWAQVLKSRQCMRSPATIPDFSVSVAPATLSLKQGQSGSATVSITPINAASLTVPMFVTLSCSGLPDQSACSFTPENIEIPVGATAAINSSMVHCHTGHIAGQGRTEPETRSAAGCLGRSAARRAGSRWNRL